MRLKPIRMAIGASAEGLALEIVELICMSKGVVSEQAADYYGTAYCHAIFH